MSMLVVCLLLLVIFVIDGCRCAFAVCVGSHRLVCLFATVCWLLVAVVVVWKCRFLLLMLAFKGLLFVVDVLLIAVAVVRCLLFVARCGLLLLFVICRCCFSSLFVVGCCIGALALFDVCCLLFAVCCCGSVSTVVVADVFFIC